MKLCAHCKNSYPKFKCGVNAVCSHYYCSNKCANAQWKTHGKFCKSLLLISGQEKRSREEDDIIQIIGQSNITVSVSREKAIAMSATLDAWNNFTQSNSNVYKLDMEFMDLNVLLDLQYFLENNGEMRPVPFNRNRFFYIEFSNLLHFLQVDKLSNVLSKVIVQKYDVLDEDALYDIHMPQEEKKIQLDLWEMCTIGYYTEALDRLKAPVIDIEKYISFDNFGPYDALNPALLLILYESVKQMKVIFSSPYVLYHLLEAYNPNPTDAWFVMKLVDYYLPIQFRKYDQGGEDSKTNEEYFRYLSAQMDNILEHGFEVLSIPHKTNRVRVAQFFMEQYYHYRSNEDIKPYSENKEFKSDIKLWSSKYGIGIVEYFVSQSDVWDFIREMQKP
jgi:hypothetical protein